MDLGLKGKAVYVAGASKGLGAATARQFAREGARVAINSRDPIKLAATAADIAAETGSEVVPVPGDVMSAVEVERSVAQAAERLGGLDIMVTNNGGPPPGKFDDLDDAAWQKAIDLQLMSAVRLIRAALPHLRRSAAPAVLTISSVSVKQPLPNLLLSSSIRMAVIGLTKSLALDLGAQGIRFNSILPSFVTTDRIKQLVSDSAQREGISEEEVAKRQAAASALGRAAQPEEFGNVAVFLCSPAASFVTGVMFNFDGGVYKATF
ncbi:MAG: SDR family oxidoreductase [Anaerolineales bacterium]|nr:SDR family oxidoreductase [Anaerolineales bacterium]